MRSTFGRARRLALALLVSLALALLIWSMVRPGADRAQALRLVQQGRAEVEAGRFSLAQKMFKQALLHDPEQVDALRELGGLGLRRQHADEAVRWLLQAEEREPGSYETIYNLSLAYRSLGRDDEARRYRDEAARLRKMMPPKPGGMGAMPGEGK
jgi:tetratricopeptide (TPR) repeat protein